MSTRGLDKLGISGLDVTTVRDDDALVKKIEVLQALHNITQAH